MWPSERYDEAALVAEKAEKLAKIRGGDAADAKGKGGKGKKGKGGKGKKGKKGGGEGGGGGGEGVGDGGGVDGTDGDAGDAAAKAEAEADAEAEAEEEDTLLNPSEVYRIGVAKLREIEAATCARWLTAAQAKQLWDALPAEDLLRVQGATTRPFSSRAGGGAERTTV